MWKASDFKDNNSSGSWSAADFEENTNSVNKMLQQQKQQKLTELNKPEPKTPFSLNKQTKMFNDFNVKPAPVKTEKDIKSEKASFEIQKKLPGAINKLPESKPTQLFGTTPKLVSFGAGLADTTTMGLLNSQANRNTKGLPVLDKNRDIVKTALNKAKIDNPNTYTAGQAAGYLIPGGAIDKTVGTATKGLTKLPKLAQGAIRGGLSGAAQELTEGTIRNLGTGEVNKENLKDIGKRTLTGGAIGAIGDTVLTGLGKVGKKIFGKNNTNLLKKEATTVNNKLNTDSNAVKPFLKQEFKTDVITPPTKEFKSISQNKSMYDVASYNKIKTVNDLPNDFDNLKKFVDHMTDNQNKGIKINLQLFAEAKARLQKLSRVKSNTLANTDIFTEAEKNMFGNKDFMYDTKSEKTSLEEAKNRLKNNYNGEVETLNNKETYSGSDVDTMFGIVSSERDIARQTGDYSKVKDMLKNTRKAGTEGGRTVQAFAKYSRTTEGALIDAQRAVDSVEENLKKTNPAKVKKINEETKKVTDAISNNKKEAADQAIKEILPEGLLAKKVSSTLKESTNKTNAITDMINELFKSAKESPLPEKINSAKRNPIEFLSQAIQNKFQYTDVWEKAKKILKEKYANDPESLSVLNDYFEKGIIPTYSNVTLDNSLKTGMKTLGQNLVEIVKSNKNDKEQTLKTLTEYLIKETGATFDDAALLSQKIQNKFNELVKQKSESMLKQMFKEVPKKGQKNTYQKVMELINLGAYDDNSIKDLIKQKEGLPVLENDDIKKISEYMDKAKEFEKGTYNNTMWVSKAQQIIADKIPASDYEKFRGLQRISLILNPKSLITRNPLGNTILGVAENVKDIPGATIDKIVSLATKERTTALNPINKLKGQASGFKQGISEFGKDIKNNVDTSPSRGQLELPSGRVFDSKTLNAIDQFERKALQLGDRPFYQAAYTGRLEELKGLGRTIDDDAKAEAKLYALDRVFQGNTVLAKKAKELKNALGIIGDIVIPFTQTPANVMDKLIDYTPGGLAKALSQIGSMGKGTFNQKLFVDRLGRSVTGTGIGILGYVMAQKGLITGGRNQDKDVANYEQSLGKNPYAFKFGDNYYTFDWAQPISGLLAAGADAYQAGKDKKDFVSSLQAGGTAAGNTIINQSFLQGLVGLMSGYSPVAGLTKTALNAPLQAAPTFGSNIAKQIDPYVRETYDPNPLKQTANKFTAKIPFASKTLPVKIDQSGKEIKQQQGAGPLEKALNLFVSPGVSTTFKPDETQKEILRLYKDAGTKIQFPTMAEKYIPESNQNPRVNLTTKEYTQYQKRLGELTTQKFKETIFSPMYKNIKDNAKYTADEMRAKILSDIILNAKNQAKKEILSARGYKTK